MSGAYILGRKLLPIFTVGLCVNLLLFMVFATLWMPWYITLAPLVLGIPLSATAYYLAVLYAAAIIQTIQEVSG